MKYNNKINYKQKLLINKLNMHYKKYNNYKYRNNKIKYNLVNLNHNNNNVTYLYNQNLQIDINN